MMDNLNDKTFYDGILTVICIKDKIKVAGERMYLDAEYNDPITLGDIAQKFPDVEMVIFEDALSGKVYTLGNHEERQWEEVGETCGYA